MSVHIFHVERLELPVQSQCIEMLQYGNISVFFCRAIRNQRVIKAGGCV